VRRLGLLRDEDGGVEVEVAEEDVAELGVSVAAFEC
jgi:hypothetical protein